MKALVNHIYIGLWFLTTVFTDIVSMGFRNLMHSSHIKYLYSSYSCGVSYSCACMVYFVVLHF